MDKTAVQPELTTNQPLPSLLTLYRRDLYYQTVQDSNPRVHACLEMPIKIACVLCLKYPKLWRFVDDFVQEGSMQILKADQSCSADWTVDRFKSYVGASIKGCLFQYLQYTFDIRIPPSMRHRMVKQRQEAAHIEWLEHHVRWELLLEHLALFPEKDIPDRTNMQVALDQAKEKRVQSLLANLPTQEREWIRLWYGLADTGEHTGREIAAHYNVHPYHVKRQINIAFKRIRGEHMRPSRESIDRERNQRLQQIYDEHQGDIGITELAELAKCHHTTALAFLQTQKSR